VLSPNKRAVLILGVEPRISVPIARSLYKHAIPVHLAALSPNEPKVHSRALRKFVRFPSSEERPIQFVDALSSFVHANDVGMLVPTTDAALSAVSQSYDALSQILHIACPSTRVLNRVLNKQTTLEIARQCGIEVPREYALSGLHDLSGLDSALAFPVVAKPRQKSSTEPFKVRYFHNPETLSSAIEKGVLKEVLLQEYCSGDGVGVEMLIHDGECLAAFQHRRLKEVPHTGGAAVVAIAESVDHELYARSLALLRALEWEGIAMVEFRHDRSQRKVALMEVNGRYWGTLSLAIQAGIDFPWYQWQLVHGERVEAPSSYKTGLRWRWSAGYIRRYRGLAQAVIKRGCSANWRKDFFIWFLDFSPRLRDALFSVHDPWPALEEILRTFGLMIRNDATALAMRVLPRRHQNVVRSYLTLGSEARSVFIRKRFARTMAKSKLPVAPGTLHNIAFVCHGNIMRSPMAEALLKRLCTDCEGLSITSAGLHAVTGREADSRAIQLAPEFGISLVDHRARPLTPALVAQADAIFAMDYLNEAELLAWHPEASNKIFLLASQTFGNATTVEIPDPYHREDDELRHCFDTVARCVESLARQLLNSRQRRKQAV
jgi:protein-tyrosine-phosphatase/predicted ATP-grasp superfamily ATP-dependent carboligase